MNKCCSGLKKNPERRLVLDRKGEKDVRVFFPSGLSHSDRISEMSLCALMTFL